MKPLSEAAKGEKLLSRVDEIRNALHTALASEAKNEWIGYAMKHLELLEEKAISEAEGYRHQADMHVGAWHKEAAVQMGTIRVKLPTTFDVVEDEEMIKTIKEGRHIIIAIPIKENIQDAS